MRTFTTAILAFAAATSVVAQDQAFLTGLAEKLTSLNLTSLIGAVTTVANTNSSTSRALLSKLSTGPFTILAPSNKAFAGVNPFFSNDSNWLTQALAYHVIPGTVNRGSIATSPDVTSYTTALTDPTIVHLGGKGQTLGLTKNGGKVFVANQNTPITLSNKTSTYRSITIIPVSGVIDLPPSLQYLLTLPDRGAADQVSTFISRVPPGLLGSLEALNSSTFFVPTNDGFNDASNNGFLSQNFNDTQLQDIFSNHVIKGSVVYTGQPQKTYKSLGGQDITVGTGGGADGKGTVVYYKGQYVADVVKGDLLTQNGVVHLISTVLPNQKEQSHGGSKRRRNSRVFAGRV